MIVNFYYFLIFLQTVVHSKGALFLHRYFSQCGKQLAGGHHRQGSTRRDTFCTAAAVVPEISLPCLPRVLWMPTSLLHALVDFVPQPPNPRRCRWPEVCRPETKPFLPSLVLPLWALGRAARAGPLYEKRESSGPHPAGKTGQPCALTAGCSSGWPLLFLSWPLARPGAIRFASCGSTPLSQACELPPATS